MGLLYSAVAAVVGELLRRETAQVEPVSDGDAAKRRRAGALARHERDRAAAPAAAAATPARGAGLVPRRGPRGSPVRPAREDPCPQRPEPEQATVAVPRVLAQVDVVESPVDGRQQAAVDRPHPVVGDVETPERPQVADVGRDLLESVAVEREIAEVGDEQGAGTERRETVVGENERL